MPQYFYLCPLAHIISDRVVRVDPLAGHLRRESTSVRGRRQPRYFLPRCLQASPGKISVCLALTRGLISITHILSVDSEAVAKLIGADADEVVLVPNATHALNTVMRNFEWREGDVIIGG